MSHPRLVTALAAMAVLALGGFLISPQIAHTMTRPEVVAREPGDWVGSDRAKLDEFRFALMHEPHHVPASPAPGQSTLTDFQQGILGDGVLTWDEYATAAAAWRHCVGEAGFPLDETAPDGLARLNKRVLQFSNAQVGKVAEEAMHACGAEYTDAIDVAWTQASEPLFRELVRVSRTATAACFVQAGFAPTARPWASTDEAVQAQFFDCARSVRAELDVAEIFGMDGDGG